MIELKSKEELKKYINAEGNLEFNDDVLIRFDLIFDKSILCKKSLYIKAVGSIEAGWSINAEGSINAGVSIEAEGAIKAGGSIEAEGSIKAGGSIEAGGAIKAGGAINAGDYIFSFIFDIKCKSLKTKRLPFWRNYWSAMPPLKKYSNQILEENLCWNDLRELTKKDAKKICAWNGWHWILKAQLEMFFGLRNEVSPPPV